jgi:hypothetical protein
MLGQAGHSRLRNLTGEHGDGPGQGRVYYSPGSFYDLGGLFPPRPPEGLPVMLGALTGPAPLGGLFPLPPPEGLPVVLGALAGRLPLPPLSPPPPPLLPCRWLFGDPTPISGRPAASPWPPAVFSQRPRPRGTGDNQPITDRGRICRRWRA